MEPLFLPDPNTRYEQGPLIVTFYRGIWRPYARGDLMALVDATAEVQSRGGSLAAVARETAPNSYREFERQHVVGFPILNDATGAVPIIGWHPELTASLEALRRL